MAEWRAGRRAVAARLAGLATVVPAVMAGGCRPLAGGPTGAMGATGPAATPSGPQRVDVWWPYADTNPSVPPAWEDFKQGNPGWTGDLTMGVTYDKFQASLAAGTVPDAYFAGFDFLQVAAYKKMFAPLDPYIARDKVNLDQYFVGSRAGAVYQGKTYGLPHHSDVRSVYVNQTVLRESGLDASRAPASWDDFRTANQRLKRTDLQGSLDRLGFDPTWQLGGPTALMYFQANGVPLLSGDGSQPGFATPAAVEALRWLAESVGAVGSIDDLGAYEKRFQNGVGDALAKNALGMALAGVWILGHFVYSAAPESEIAQWPMPGGPSARGKTFGYYSGTTGVVPAAAARPDAGWAFTRYQASVNGQRFIQAVDGSWDQACIPAVANDPVVLQKQPWRKRANELMTEARLPAYFPFPGAADIGAAMEAALKPLLQGAQGPDATLQDMKQQVQVVMDQYR